MRRGHPGLGGWRSDNPRHFRPRSGGTPHYRAPRNYGLLEPPRYPLSASRIHRGHHSFNTHPENFNELGTIENHDRNYRGRTNDQQRFYDRGHDHQPYNHNHSRKIYPPIQRIRHDNAPEHCSSFKSSHSYKNPNQSDLCHINNLGDIDHRQSRSICDFNQRNISPWINPPPPGDNQRYHYDNRSYPNDQFRCSSIEASTNPIVDIGHRPPASDHYGSTPRPAVDNNNTSFSRSIIDTVDIVRKRLMNRSDSQTLFIDQSIDPNYPNEEARESTHSLYPNAHPELPTKKRIQRQKQLIKSNCDKIKTKIVHQLFKMDKDRIHKLMDDPSSSTKFEYAISSLITESQNSLNRHMRSVAEKSLCSSSEDFIHNDNNTIYEDTFMKQMQCILEPQDTVLLEDIKPLVMAELSKVLQLNDFEDRFDTAGGHQMYPQPRNEHYVNEFDYDELPQDKYYECTNTASTGVEVDKNYNYNQEKTSDQSIPICDSHTVRQSNENSDRMAQRINSEDQRKARKSLDNRPAKIEEPLPLFDASGQFSDSDDPFDELDKQYHVAVDHNFIEIDDQSNQQTILSSCGGSPNTLYNIHTPYIDPEKIKKEVDTQILNIAKSPIKLLSALNNNIEEHRPLSLEWQIKQEFPDQAKENEVTMTNTGNIWNQAMKSSVKQEEISQPKLQLKESEKSEISMNESKFTAVSTSRKRSIDQRPSHRKEKRKKSESSQSDTSYEISNKNPSIQITKDNDCSSKPIEKSHESANSVLNLFFSNEAKDPHKGETVDKTYSEKYVKRKEVLKKARDKEIETKKKHNHNSTSHSTSGTKDNNQISSSKQTPTKMDKDPKTKLKPIDMFTDLPKKTNSIHQAHRNTATVTVTKNIEENKPKKSAITPSKTTKISVATQVTPQSPKKLLTKETQTCISKVTSSRFSQTDKNKVSNTSTQTDSVTFEAPKLRSIDTFERMKEIDLEIQGLLQEKFKLYSSLESKDTNQGFMETLGMAVLNVETTKEYEDNEPDTISEDTIVNEFTNIPVEELEQIALESSQDEITEELVIDQKSLRILELEQESEKSETPNTKRRNITSKAPNISLIEQIITGDRPLNDILSMDVLENVVKQNPKVKRKRQKTRPKKRTPARKSKLKPDIKMNPYDLKECVILLLREDLSRYMRHDPEVGKEEHIPSTESPSEKPIIDPEILLEPIEELLENDIQFDMLDVSEDIVIGDSCEVKSIEDKENERVDVPIAGELIYDNSQSSMEDVTPSESAQSDNECKTYDYSSDENLQGDTVTVIGNADSVLAIECVENNFIAACLDGNVYHFKSDGQLISTLRGSNLAVTCFTIVRELNGHTVYTGSLDSRVRYYDLETAKQKGPECNVLSPIQTMDQAWDTVFVGTRTGFVLQFECKNNMLIPVSTVKFSEYAILALRAMKEGPRKVLIVAARSENVTIKDAQTGLLLRTLSGPKMTVYTLLFEDGKVYCGTSSHHIHVFDYSSGGHMGSHQGGKGAVCLLIQGGLLFAGCYDGCVYVYREGVSRPLALLKGPRGFMLLSLAIVGTKMIAGYKDRSLYIWKLPLSILQEMIL